MTTVKIKSGDTAIEFTSTLQTNGTAVNLTGATVVMLLKLGDAAGTSHSATIVSAAAGTVKCVPGGSFPTTAGRYLQEWQVTFSDTTILTFPSDGYNFVVILDDLN
jgi:hypothetical protein